MKRLFLIFILLGAWGSASRAGPLRNGSYESIKAYYERMLPKLSITNAPLSRRAVTVEHLKRTKMVRVDAPLYLLIDQISGEIRLVLNRPLDRSKRAEDKQTIPELSILEALQRARTYLALLEVALPTNCVIQRLAFNQGYPSQWDVRWAPSVNGYMYDEFLHSHEQSVAVIFHEKDGLVCYGRDWDFPPPKSTEVKISRNDAILKASKCVPLVMKTPFYQGARAQGFKVTELKSAELKIAMPNWLLDPKRAIWLLKTPPKETRLCWIVIFTTVDSKKRKKGLKLLPVDVLIYIDAGTGEVVGANFS